MAGESVQANSYPQLRACRRREYLEDPTGCSQWVLRLRSQELDARAMEISAHLSVLFRESRRTHPPVPRGGGEPKHLTRGSTQGSSIRLVSVAILAL